MPVYILNKTNTCSKIAHLSGAIILCLKFLVKKGHDSKNIAFRVVPLALQLHCCVLILFILFEKWAILKFLHNANDDNNNDDLTITIA